MKAPCDSVRSRLKESLAIAVVVLATSCQNRNANTSEDNGQDVKTVIQLKRDMVNAYVRGDTKTLEHIFADELTTTSDSWKVLNGKLLKLVFRSWRVLHG
jgi:hypothetical protein